MRKKIIPNRIMEEFNKNPQIGRIQLATICDIPESEARFFCRVYKEMTTGINYESKGVAIWDLHHPEHDKASWLAVKEFIKDFKPDNFVFGGDQQHFDTISSFNKYKPGLIEGKRVKKEYESFQKEILTPLEDALPAYCKKYYIVGNHEYRIERLIEKNPQYEGFIELQNNLDLTSWTVIPFNEVFNIGGMYFTHGWWYNVHYAKKTVLQAQKMIFVGHVHRPQVYTSASPAYALPKQCVGIGCMCNVNPDYLENKPSAWVHQFLFWYMNSDGTFTYYTPILINGRFIANGKVYDGNELLAKTGVKDGS